MGFWEIILVIAIIGILFGSYDGMQGIAVVSFGILLVIGIIELIQNGLDHFYEHYSCYLFIAIIILAVVVGIIVGRKQKDKVFGISLFFAVASGGFLAQLILMAHLKTIFSMRADVLAIMGILFVPLQVIFMLVLMAISIVISVGAPILGYSLGKKKKRRRLARKGAIVGSICGVAFSCCMIFLTLMDYFTITFNSFGKMFH